MAITKHKFYWVRQSNGFYRCRCGAELSVGESFGTVIDGEIFCYKARKVRNR